jgi:hypothetical protein
VDASTTLFLEEMLHYPLVSQERILRQEVERFLDFVESRKRGHIQSREPKRRPNKWILDKILNVNLRVSSKKETREIIFSSEKFNDHMSVYVL